MLEAIDLETTSLPNLEYNKTKITELSMVVVKRRHVLETRPGQAPRVVDKLTLCFNPGRMIDPGSTDASGLCNDLLEDQTLFNMNVFNTIKGFLQCLEKPVCLIAQNGRAFDFPILKNHFEKLNVCLPDHIMCADSLYAFHDIFELNHCTVPSSSVGSDSRALDTIDKILGTTTTDAAFDKIPKVDIKTSDSSKELMSAELLKDLNGTEDLSDQTRYQQLNENTPKSNMFKCKTPFKKNISAKRKLFWGNNPKPKESYKLENVYKRVLRRDPPEAHHAENDCIMAMEIAVSIAKQFVDWVDSNSIPFTEVNAMKIGVPLK